MTIADTNQLFTDLPKVNLQFNLIDMKMNMGNADRIIRILLALVVAILYFTDVITGTLAYILLAVAAIFLLTSLLGRCPLYSLFGIKTRSAKKI